MSINSRALRRILQCITLFLLAFLPAKNLQAQENPTDLHLLCTTFPVWLITRNVTIGRTGATVNLLLSAQMGCPHDYTLAPQDMQKLADAQVLIINGNGMEEFLGAPVKKANAKLKTVDATHGIPAAELLRFTDTPHGEEPEIHHASPTTAHADHHVHDSGENHAENEHHAHTGINPHLFVSPRLAGLMALEIATGLAKIDPAGKAIYDKNAVAYNERMLALSNEFIALGKTLANRNIVTQHGAFDYLARDMGLRIISVLAAHAGQEPSAAEMINILKVIKEKKAGAIFTEPQYPAKVGQTIAKEAGIQAATLDPAASGPDNASLDYYETIMHKNLQTLRNTLGTR